MDRHTLAICTISLLLTHCTSSPVEPDKALGSGDTPAQHGGSPGNSSTIRGYQHDLSRSFFDPGDNPSDLNEHGFNKVKGSYGVFSVDPTNGSVMASRSTTGVFVPYRGTPEHHNGAVLAYLRNAGLPSDQIGDVQINTLMQGGGSAVDGHKGMEGPHEIVGFVTNVGRRVSGYPVAESVAWVQLDGNGRVVAETIYWPDLPSSVVDAAKSFTAKLADGSEAFHGRLPSGIDPGRVVIHHSSMVEHVAFQTSVTYDAMTTDKHGGYTRHFDDQLHEVRLPREQVMAAGDPR